MITGTAGELRTRIVRGGILRTAGIGLVYGALAALALWPVLAHDSWPLNHEMHTFFVRTRIYADHLQHGDLIPVWSGADNWNLGSPQPALYHRLFYLGSGALTLLVGDVRGAVVLAVWTLLVIGAIGLLRAARWMGTSMPVSVLAGITLIFANYTCTEWLVRGAMAEFAAIMIMPWLLASMIKGMRRGQFGMGVPITLALVFLAHQVMALYLFVLLLPVIAMIVIYRREWLLHSWRALLVGAVGGLALVTPFALASRAVSSGYEISRILPDQFLPTNQFVNLRNYVRDSGWSWGQDPLAFTVQLDTGLLFLLSIVAIFAVLRIRELGPLSFRSPQVFMMTSLVLMLTVGIVFQTRLATPLYEFIPGLRFIQFPWRLLGYITPLLILVSFRGAQWAIPRKALLPLVSLVALVTVVTSGSLRPIHYSYFTPQEMTAVTTSDGLPEGWNFSMFGEYVPESISIDVRSAVSNAAQRNEAMGCHVLDAEHSLEPTTREFKVICGSRSEVVLPLLASDFHVVNVPGGTRLCRPVLDYPEFCGVEVPAGETNVRVGLPTYSSILQNL